jgi:hypothetical protein
MSLAATAIIHLNSTAQSGSGSGLSLLARTYEAATLSSGAGLNQANQIWVDIDSLIGPDDFTSLDMRSPGVSDQLGQPLAFTTIKLFYIKNNSDVPGNDLWIGGGVTMDTSWNSPFGGSDEAQLIIPAGGSLLLVAPSAAGFAVEEDTNQFLSIENHGSESIEYEIIIIGA